MVTLRGMGLIPFLFLTGLNGCSLKSGETVVLEIGPNKVTLREYEEFYNRNGGGIEAARKISAEEREHFLELLANYKLKLQDAYDRRLPGDTDIVRELREYRTNLATTYLIEKEISKPGIKQLYERRTEEIRAQHILFRLGPEATPQETIKAFSKAMEVIKAAKRGARFDLLALQYSEDPTVKQNGGDLYYFTGGQMVGAFENAAYSMRKGELSDLPVRSPFGYHIIQIVDRKPVRGSIKVSHIMTRFQNATDQSDTANALVRIRAVRDSLSRGWEFHQLAKRFSEDVGSSNQNGDLGWFERRRFVLPFDEAAFKLQMGETSGIIKSPFGYHLIHCDSVKPMQPFMAIAEEMKKLYQQQRYQEDYERYVSVLKREYNLAVQDEVMRTFLASLDSSKTTDDTLWGEGISPNLRVKPLIVMDGHSLTVDSIITMLSKKTDFRSTPLRRSEITSKIERISEILLLERRAEGLESRDPDFKELMNEYADGIVLYKAEQMEVWNKTSVSDSSLRRYYQQHLAAFMSPAQVNISVLTFDSDTLAYMVYDSLLKGRDYNSLVARYGENREGRKQDGSRGMQQVDTDTLTRYALNLKTGEMSEPLELESGTTVIVKLMARTPAHPKSYEDAGAEVSNAYQDHESKELERQWLDKIRLRYPVKEYPDALRDAFKQP